MSFKVLFAVLSLFICNNVGGNATRLDPLTNLQEFIERSNYNRKLPPIESTEVKIAVFLARSFRISEEDSTWKAEFYLKQKWVDKRLVYPENLGGVSQLPVGEELENLLWSPNTYLPESVVESTKPSVSYKFTDDGWVTKISRFIGQFPCVFNNTSHPKRLVVCSLNVANFEDDSSVSYTWEHGSNSTETKEGVLDTGEFVFIGQKIKLTELHGSDGPSVLTAQFFFKRNFLQECRLILLPVLIFVCVSLLALFVPIEKLTCRFILSVVSMLGATAVFMYYVSQVANRGPVSTVEKFLYSCLAAIALTLVDHLLASYRVVYKEKEQVTYVEARDSRSYLSQQQYRVLQKHPDHQRLLQCTPEPKESRWNRFQSCCRRSSLWLVAVLDWLLRMAILIVFGVCVFLFCEKWCNDNTIQGLENPNFRTEKIVTILTLLKI